MLETSFINFVHRFISSIFSTYLFNPNKGSNKENNSYYYY